MAPRRRKVASDTPLDIQESSPAGSKITMAASDSADAPHSGGWSTQAQWLFFAIASGICAACNGAFAKLYVQSLCQYEDIQHPSSGHLRVYPASGTAVTRPGVNANRPIE